MTFKSKSSNVSHVKYNKDTQVLEVTFQNGSTYHYPEVSLLQYLSFKAAPSHGVFLRKNIIPKHRGIKK